MALIEEQRNPWRAIVAGGDYNLTSQDWEDLLTELDSLYTEAPIAQPASDYKKLIAQLKDPEIHFPGNFDTAKRANALLMCLCQEAADALSASAPSEQKPRFECWSTNEGDSWYENPEDAELLYDVLGDSPKVGDEFEVMAGWYSVQARYRIVSQKDDDFDVECISHPEDNAAPHPNYKAQRDELIEALGIAQATINCAGISTPKIVCDAVEKYAAIASVKGGAA